MSENLFSLLALMQLARTQPPGTPFPARDVPGGGAMQGPVGREIVEAPDAPTPIISYWYVGVWHASCICPCF